MYVCVFWLLFLVLLCAVCSFVRSFIRSNATRCCCYECCSQFHLPVQSGSFTVVCWLHCSNTVHVGLSNRSNDAFPHSAIVGQRLFSPYTTSPSLANETFSTLRNSVISNLVYYYLDKRFKIDDLKDDDAHDSHLLAKETILYR